jgi:hypothetical protein
MEPLVWVFSNLGDKKITKHKYFKVLKVVNFVVMGICKHFQMLLNQIFDFSFKLHKFVHKNHIYMVWNYK